MEDIIYGLWLSLTAGVNNSQVKEVLDLFKDFKSIYDNIEKVAGYFKDSICKKLMEKDLSYAEDEYRKTIEKKIILVSYYDDIYPSTLKDIPSPPVLLYCKGNVNLLSEPCLSVAGSRKCSQDGKKNTSIFVRSINNSGITPVSGFSAGIEAEVCRRVNNCIIITPCGVDVTYPAKQFSLKNTVLKNGGLIISEQPLGMKALPGNFYPRNRIVAGISPYTFIVEAGDKSRTEMIFNLCDIYQRKVFTIPGSIYSEHYIGNNKYLKNGAIPVTEPCDIINFYKLIYPEITDDEIKSEPSDTVFAEDNTLDDDQNKILKILSEKQVMYDELIEKANIPPNKIASALTMLEMLGKIENTGGHFKLKV